MNKDSALKLKKMAEKIAKMYSIEDRKLRNYNSETFEVGNILPLSEDTACVILKKTPGGKMAIAFCMIIKDEWKYFFPKDSHILGMTAFAKYKEEVEQHNFRCSLNQ